MEKHDITVIGAGPGGYPAAIRATQLGASVALIEKEELGGTCLNRGCIPTKALISAASLYWAITHAGDIGISAEKTSFDYAAMIQRKNSIIDKLRGGISHLLKANGVKVYKGAGSFAERNRLHITNGKDKGKHIETSYTIIASGSKSVLPPFLPASERIVESSGFLDMNTIPASMLVLGGGIIGCEIACLAARLGTQVTVVELLDDILPMLDPDVRAEARRYMENQLKIRILTGHPLENLQSNKDMVTGSVNGKKVESELLLSAVGRRPVTDGLSLENAGLTPESRGYISVDEYGQTKVATVYAVGDVTGGPQLAHAATSQGISAAEHALGYCRSVRLKAVPSCIFTIPEIGIVGLSEQEAKKQNIPVKTGKFMFAALGKAIASGETGGFVKWIVDPETEQLLGAQAVGAHATELIAEATVAIQAELTASELAGTIHAHPTMSEAWMEAARAVRGECIHAPPRRKRT